MKELSILDHGLSLANSASGLIRKAGSYKNTRTVRKAREKLYSSLETLQGARRIIDRGNGTQRDIQRSEALVDGFTRVAFEDILDTLERG